MASLFVSKSSHGTRVLEDAFSYSAEHVSFASIREYSPRMVHSGFMMMHESVTEELGLVSFSIEESSMVFSGASLVSSITSDVVIFDSVVSLQDTALGPVSGNAEPTMESEEKEGEDISSGLTD